MTPEGIITRDDFRDAIGWMYAVFNRDRGAKSALAVECDPAGLVEALATMYGGLIMLGTNACPLTYLNYMRDHLDEWLDASGAADQ